MHETLAFLMSYMQAEHVADTLIRKTVTHCTLSTSYCKSTAVLCFEQFCSFSVLTKVVLRNLEQASLSLNCSNVPLPTWFRCAKKKYPTRSSAAPRPCFTKCCFFVSIHPIDMLFPRRSRSAISQLLSETINIQTSLIQKLSLKQIHYDSLVEGMSNLTLTQNM